MIVVRANQTSDDITSHMHLGTKNKSKAEEGRGEGRIKRSKEMTRTRLSVRGGADRKEEVAGVERPTPWLEKMSRDGSGGSEGGERESGAV